MNPDESRLFPAIRIAAPLVDGPDELREVVRHHRNVNLSLAGHIGCVVLRFLTRGDDTSLPVVVLVGLLSLAVLAFSMVATARLTTALYGRQTAIIATLLMFVPLVSLLTLYFLNHQASKLARAAGLKVGLLGGHPNALDDAVPTRRAASSTLRQ